MEYQVIFKKRLTEIIDPEFIIGVTETTTSHFGGRTLVITVKSNYDSYPYIHYYGYPDSKRLFISMSKFTHHIPEYSVLPKEFWDDIQIIKKKNVDASAEFIKARITKKVSW